MDSSVNTDVDMCVSSTNKAKHNARSAPFPWMTTRSTSKCLFQVQRTDGLALSFQPCKSQFTDLLQVRAAEWVRSVSSLRVIRILMILGCPLPSLWILILSFVVSHPKKPNKIKNKRTESKNRSLRWETLGKNWCLNLVQPTMSIC